MTRHNLIKKMFLITLMAAVTVIYSATCSFAGYYGGCPKKNDSPCPVASGNTASLTEEQVQSLNTERQNFRNDTAELRQQLQAKQSELATAISAGSDEETLTAIQKDLSELKAQFDQKRVVHMARMQQIAPGACMGYKNAGPGCGRRCKW
ncbi:hypothetical protein DENIS_2322 [Desulfonema ishimotonii]|uniref:Zinc resistance-associated protein n=1 Tax=Desulfonema ishimotonii TaxID=45657 RepID=A0A401FWH9_9BACT|nr:periplasmic heavy metal sensor [Desulfonema ishimotonii]GBC61362.1 hypothetical protein DENIS_2322 [Desulfonema ishimotonii]